MPDEYISREAVLGVFGDIHPMDYNANAYVSKIKAIPAADVVDVVRCEKCRHWMPEDDISTAVMQCVKGLGWPGPDGYCYRGERKDGANDG